MNIKPKITIEDLYHLPENGKAEIVNGELVYISPAEATPDMRLMRFLFP